MKRFLTSTTGSSSAAQPASPHADTRDAGAGSAEQPAGQNVLKNLRGVPLSCGAERPALKKLAMDRPAGTEHQATALTSLECCATWLSTVTTNTADEPVRRLVEALHVLQAKPSRTRRNDIQSMLKSWGVTQKTNETKIAAPEVEAMLERKVLAEACRLKTLHDSHGSSSAIRLTLGMPPQWLDKKAENRKARLKANKDIQRKVKEPQSSEVPSTALSSKQEHNKSWMPEQPSFSTAPLYNKKALSKQEESTGAPVTSAVPGAKRAKRVQCPEQNEFKHSPHKYV